MSSTRNQGSPIARVGLFREADFVADGAPLMWASRLQGTPLPGRVAGSDLVWALSAEAALRGKSLYLLGGDSDASSRAEETLRDNYRGIRIARSYAPPIVYVALGFPKQGIPLVLRLFGHGFVGRLTGRARAGEPRAPVCMPATPAADLAADGDPLPISVVIPAFGRPEMVERAIRSALRQTRPPGELIVVDDASGDDTARRAEALGARVIAHAENRGRSAARNTGLSAARNAWVALLDSDDEWLEDHLSALWKVRDRHVLVGSAALAVGPDGRAARTYGPTGRRPKTLRTLADVAFPESRLVTSAVMLRRDAALDAGGFRPGMERAEDLELWGRMLRTGTGVAVPRVTALHHLHEGQISADAPQMWAAHAEVVSSNGSPGSAWLRRAEGVRMWDAARAGRAPLASTAARAIASPQRLIGVAQLLAARRRARRAAAAFTRAGRS